jgi:hypothetical protein
LATQEKSGSFGEEETCKAFNIVIIIKATKIKTKEHQFYLVAISGYPLAVMRMLGM